MASFTTQSSEELASAMRKRRFFFLIKTTVNWNVGGCVDR